MDKSPDFLKDATNVYRTNKYIVKQNIFVELDDDGNSRIYSKDIYYLRNKKLDKLFNCLFEDRYNLEGKRLHSTSYERKYII